MQSIFLISSSAWQPSAELYPMQIMLAPGSQISLLLFSLSYFVTQSWNINFQFLSRSRTFWKYFSKGDGNFLT
jgi:hypothetical protein